MAKYIYRKIMLRLLQLNSNIWKYCRSITVNRTVIGHNKAEMASISTVSPGRHPWPLGFRHLDNYSIHSLSLQGAVIITVNKVTITLWKRNNVISNFWQEIMECYFIGIVLHDPVYCRLYRYKYAGKLEYIKYHYRYGRQFIF